MAKPPEKLTKSLIDGTAAPPPGKRIILRDADVKGFAIRITPTARNFLVAHRIKGGQKSQAFITIGAYPAWPIDEARKKARELIVDMDKGIDPRPKVTESEVKKITLAQAFSDYKVAHPKLRERTIGNYTRSFDVYLKAWHDLPLDQITASMVSKRHLEIGKIGEADANAAMRLLRALFNFQINFQIDSGVTWLSSNPVDILKKLNQWFEEKPGQNIIQRHQMSKWFEGLSELRRQGNAVMADYALFVLFMGARRNEATGLLWKQISLGGNSVILQAKGGKVRLLPIPRHMAKLLADRLAQSSSPFVFPSPQSKTGHIVEPRAGLDMIMETKGIKCTVQDLRRTFSTMLESLDPSVYAHKALMGHSIKGDVTGKHYNVIEVERLREPMQKLEDLLMDLAGINELP